jgi:fatty-acyl-CoA synthase
VLSTMQDEPLSLATLLRYASTFQSDATVSTWTGEGTRSITFGEVGEQAARLANALRGLGVGVGKFDKKALRARYAEGDLDVTKLT